MDMRKTAVSAALVAVAAAALGGCFGGGDGAVEIERRFDDAVVRTQVDADQDMVAEVFVAKAQVATLDWSTAASAGAFVVGDRDYAVDFDRPDPLSADEVSELAYELWRGTPDVGSPDEADKRLCVGGPGWECCLAFPEIIRCQTY
jgi:hypothetical protein